MNEILDALGRWGMDVKALRKHMYSAPTPRERERWHAIWLLVQGWSAAQVAEALARDAHTIGAWGFAFREQGPDGLSLEQTGGSPPPLTRSNKRR
jgi:transposase